MANRFFLELFVHWSLEAYWAPTDLGSSSFSLLSFCLFIVFMGFSRQEYWSGLPFPSPVGHILSVDHTLHMDMSRWSTLKSDWLYSLQPKMEKLYTVSKTRPGVDCGSDHELLIACLAWLQNKLFKLQRHLFYPPHRIIRKEINPEYSLKGLMLKLKLQNFRHLMRRADSLEKILMLERLKANGEGGDRGCDSWMASSTQWTQVWANSGR